MELVRVAGATLNQTPFDWAGNEQRIRSLLDQARAQGVDVLCLPELCITGYSCEDMYFNLHTAQMAERVLGNLIEATAGMTVVFGMPIYHHGAMYNAAVVVQDGVVLGANPKKILPREGVHYEHRWFKPWQFRRVETTGLTGREIPFGDVRYQLGSLGLAIEICEESWGANAAAAEHAKAGVELVVNTSASHFALGKVKARETLITNSSRSMQVHYVYANLLGLEAGRVIFDGGVYIAECGTITARGERFGFHDGALTIKDVDLDRARVGKLKNRAVRDEPDPTERVAPVVKGKNQVRKEFGARAAIKAADRIHFQAAPGQWQLSEEEEFLAAEMLALFDYLRKTRAKGYVVSLSGGCDSSAVATLVGQTLACALAELGPDELARRLHLPKPAGDATNPRSWINQILTVAYQATAQSGQVTRMAASTLATELNAEYHEIDVDALVKGYVSRAEQTMGRPLTWDRDDLSLQNIQARARAPMIWLIANIKGAILLSTSNRSEAAVGYATMDGDTAGGLAPIGGIDKHWLRRWLVWAETACGWGLGPIKSLGLVNCQAPTAELRPTTAAQSDETDLMPYAVLARIERFLVRDRMAPQEILSVMASDFPEFDEAQHRIFLERFLKLWCQNQWKRERYAPSFHLDDYSLDPKTWCRFPILSGGFQTEIAALKKQD